MLLAGFDASYEWGAAGARTPAEAAVKRARVDEDVNNLALVDANELDSGEKLEAEPAATGGDGAKAVTTDPPPQLQYVIAS